MLVPIRLIYNSVNINPVAVRFQDDTQTEFQVEVSYDFYKELIANADESDFLLTPSESELTASMAIQGVKEDGTYFIPEDKDKFCESFTFDSTKYKSMIHILFFANEDSQEKWRDCLAWHNYLIYKKIFPMLCGQSVGGVASQISFNDKGDKKFCFTTSLISRFSMDKCKEIFESIYFDVIDEIVIDFKKTMNNNTLIEVSTDVPFGEGRYFAEEMEKEIYNLFQPGDNLNTNSTCENNTIMAVPIRARYSRKTTYLKLHVNQAEPAIGWEKTSDKILKSISESIIEDFCDTSKPFVFYYLESRKATIRYIFCAHENVNLEKDFKKFLREMVIKQIFEDFKDDAEFRKILMDGPTPLGIMDVQMHQDVDDELYIEIDFTT